MNIHSQIGSMAVLTRQSLHSSPDNLAIRGSAGVDCLIQDDEVHAESLELPGQHGQMMNAAG